MYTYVLYIIYTACVNIIHKLFTTAACRDHITTGPRNWIRFIVGSDLWTVIIFNLKLWINVRKTSVIGCIYCSHTKHCRPPPPRIRVVSVYIIMNISEFSFYDYYTKRRERKKTKRATALYPTAETNFFAILLRRFHVRLGYLLFLLIKLFITRKSSATLVSRNAVQYNIM